MTYLLYDRLLEYEMVPEIDTVIKADNVYKYFFEIAGNKEIDLTEDLPNIAPPFDFFFIEWSTPRDMKSVTPHLSRKEGVLFFSFEVDKNPELLSAIPSIYFSQGLPLGKWIMGADLFQEGSRGGLYHQGRFGIAIDESGKYIKPHGENGLLYSVEDRLRNLGNIDDVLNYMIGNVTAALLAISFLHCKNVDLVKSPFLPATKKRSRKISHIRYYTLNIHPMVGVINEQGKAQSTGIKLALHICRGHFKDYSKGNGLFGTHKGLYWWSDQVRGNLSQGAVVKDYRVNPPSN